MNPIVKRVLGSLLVFLISTQVLAAVNYYCPLSMNCRRNNDPESCTPDHSAYHVIARVVTRTVRTGAPYYLDRSGFQKKGSIYGDLIYCNYYNSHPSLGALKLEGHGYIPDYIGVSNLWIKDGEVSVCDSRHSAQCPFLRTTIQGVK